MLTPQFHLPGLNYEVIADNFAGGGGASTGIEWALGRPVDVAINHDEFALGMHAINHPQSRHIRADVFEVDPRKACGGYPCGLAHFSPDCTDFSKAKGGKPLDKKIRGLVLVMLRWAAYGTRVMTMENVEEITGWGPLILVWNKKTGKKEWQRDSRYIGRTWLAFLSCLSTGIAPDHPDLPEILSVVAPQVTREDLIRGFGYQYEARKIRACDKGSPTIRKRLYMIARGDGRPIIWPADTHTAPRSGVRGLLPHRIIADCIDWDRPCPSIFITKKEAKARGWNVKRPLAPASLRRIAMGIDRFVLKAEEPFIVSLTHGGNDAHRIHPTNQPGQTITAANRGEKGVVLTRYHGDHEAREDGAGRNSQPTAPLGVQDTSNRYGLIETTHTPFITEHANASSQRNMPAGEPARTICGEVKGGHLALVSGSMVVNTSGHPGAPADEPARALTTGNQEILVAGTMIQGGYGEAEGQAPRALDIQKPGGTAVAGGVKQYPVAGVLIGAGGPAYSGEPRPVDGQAGTLTTRENAAFAAATLIHAAHGEECKSGKKRRGKGAHDVRESMPTVLASPDAAVAMLKLRGSPDAHPSAAADEPGHTISTARNHGVFMTKFCTGSVGQEADEPLTTITAGTHAPETRGGAASVHGLTAAYLAQHNGGFNKTPGHPATDPASTIGTKGCQQQLVAVHAETYYGSGSVGGAASSPARTLRTMESTAQVESTILYPPMTDEQIAGARCVAAFLREHGVQFEGEFATVRGLVMVDIGMRMLTPRELFRAQGFGENYVIDRAWIVNPATGRTQEVKLTKEQQIRMCGNSVCPQVMAALVAANAPELAVAPPHELRKLVAALTPPRALKKSPAGYMVRAA